MKPCCKDLLYPFLFRRLLYKTTTKLNPHQLPILSLENLRQLEPPSFHLCVFHLHTPFSLVLSLFLLSLVAMPMRQQCERARQEESEEKKAFLKQNYRLVHEWGFLQWLWNMFTLPAKSLCVITPKCHIITVQMVSMFIFTIPHCPSTKKISTSWSPSVHSCVNDSVLTCKIHFTPKSKLSVTSAGKISNMNELCILQYIQTQHSTH